MKNYKTALITAIVALLGVLLIGSVSTSVAQVNAVNCNRGGVLQDAIDAAPSNETIFVVGNCNENIRIGHSKRDLTIDGLGSARITAADDNVKTVSIFGSGITIQNFRVIRGGSTGIFLSDSASAKIKNNRIRGARGPGIAVEGNSFATIIGNRIRRNGGNGINIFEASSARIGTNCTEEALNVIARNGQSGISLIRNAEASILGNIIRNNGTNGIFVADSSMADTGSNVITGNGGDGIDVRRGSSVRMGRRNAPDSCQNNPNSTNQNNLNGGIGIDCQSLSTVDGVLGSLNGANGDANLRDDNSNCPNCCFASVSLDPTNEAPVANFTFTTENLTAQFTDLSTDSDGTVDAWSWKFGDGGTSTEQNPSHTYAEAGTYIVSLIVTDDKEAESVPRAIDFVEVTAAPPSDDVVQVFVTSTAHQGDLGGLAGADAICQERAEAAGLPGTDWTAWLSDGTTNAVGRISDGQYRLLNGTVVANSKADLTDGMLEAPINLNEYRQAQVGFAWSATNLDGTGTGNTCNDWTDASSEQGGCPDPGDPNCGSVGSTSASNAEWTKLNAAPFQCSAQYNLYCFGVSQ